MEAGQRDTNEVQSKSNALVRRLMGAGLQCQLLGAPPMTRLRLRQLCWLLRDTLVPKPAEIDRARQLLSAVEWELNEIVAEVPGFVHEGVRYMSPHDFAPRAVAMVDFKRSLLHRLGNDLQPIKEEYDTLLSAKRKLEGNTSKPTQAAKLLEIHQRMRALREQIMRVEEKIRAVTFFGVDVYEENIYDESDDLPRESPR